MYVGRNTGWSGGFGLNCPGDPECGARPDVTTPVTDQTQINQIWDYLNTQSYGQSIVPTAAPTQSFTQWLNDNAGKVALGVGGFFALMLFAKAGR